MPDSPDEVRVTVKCNCGQVHQSIEDWQRCPMALVPLPNDPWWRLPPKPVQSHDEVARELLHSICGTMVDEDSGSKLIRDALQNAFDMGFKAAGGTVG